MENSYSLSDLSAVTNGNGFGGNSSWWIIILFVLLCGGNGWNRGGDYGQFATAASQQDILFSSKFSALDNKIDRLSNGLADLGYALNNSIKDGNSMVAGRVVDEGRAMQSQLADCCCKNQANVDALRYDMATQFANANATTTAQTQKILDAMAQNKIDTLQSHVNTLQNQIALKDARCGVPKINPYMYGIVPQYSGCNCGCNGNI